MNATPVWAIFVSSIFTNNILLALFLGMCSFLVCSNRVDTALGLGTAVTFVMVSTTALNFLIYHYVLVPLGLEFLSFIVFIAVIAAFVQFVEMFVERFSPRLVGPVLDGTADQHSEVNLHLFADPVEMVGHFLMEQHIPHELGERRLRMPSGDQARLPEYRFLAGDVAMALTVFSGW